MESVTYNDPTPEENISLEQQAAMQEEAQEQRDQQQPTQQPEETPTETPETPERPEWLPEKFDSPESMAEAYGQLEQRFHEKSNNNNEQSEDNSEEAEATPAMGEVVTAASDEYYENGTLSDSAYQSLEEAGLSRDVVDTYVQGFEALQSQQEESLQAEIGGKDNYESMSDWASTALTDQEQTVYNNTVESGDRDAAAMAIRGLYARYVADGGDPVALVQGGTAGNALAVPFGSSYEMTQSMADPRYDNDEGYRRSVEARIAVTP
jgi:hypothetical protein